MRKTLIGTVSCLLTLFPTHAGATSKPGETLILQHVNVVDTHQGKVRHNVTVVIQNARIQSISDNLGPPQTPEAQTPEAQTIDATGKYLIPGLWDMHVHTALTPAWDEQILYPLYVVNGITGIRDMGGDPALLEKRRESINKGDLSGPHIVMPGPFLVHGKSSAEVIAVNSPEDARQAVDTLKKRGVDFIKILDGLTRESYFAIAQESAKQHMSFVGHLPYGVSAAEASRAGQRSIEHLSGVALACSSKETLLREQMVAAAQVRDYKKLVPLRKEVTDSYDAAKARTLFKLLQKNQTWQVPTLVWTKATVSLDAPDILSDSRLAYVPQSVRLAWNPQKLLQSTSVEEINVTKAEIELNRKMVKAMNDAAVPLLSGSDGPDPFVFPGFSLHDEMEWLVKSGLTPLQALQTATLNPAAFLGKPELYGAVESGHAADLVLLEANPLEDIRNTRGIAAVILGGKYYSRADLDKKLAKIRELAASH